MATHPNAGRRSKTGLRSNAGFTLIELLLVVIIIGTLVAIAAPRLTGRSEQARVAAARADIDGALGVALDLFELDVGRYPSTDEGLKVLSEAPSSGRGRESWQGPYVKKPAMTDPWKNQYGYRSPGQRNPHSYDLYSMGPDGLEGTDDDITNWDSGDLR